mmetsp:Transcript_71964/g.153895  ORF Transcript_71964/g.153895 Transcript_71964/m.153895 type:complete len:591 (+) Transcript_71964:201-1973(+)
MQLIDFAEAIAPYFAEFLGTFAVVFTMGCNAVAGSGTWMPTSVAFAVMVAMYSTSAVSGGHLNPALSFAFGLTGKVWWPRVLLYWCMQVAAGLLAALLVSILLGEGVTVGPKPGYDWVDALIVESVYSTTFCFVALNCMASVRNNPKEDRNQFFAIAVGFVAIAGGHTTRDVSGAFFNPAVTLGFGLLSGTVGERAWCLLYAAYQMGSAVLATALFFLVRPEELSILGIGGKGVSVTRAIEGVRVNLPSRFRGDRTMTTPSLRTAGEAEEGSAASPFAASSTGISTGGGGEEESALWTDPDFHRAPHGSRILSEILGTYVVVFTFVLSSMTVAMAKKEVIEHHPELGPLPGNSTLPQVHFADSDVTSATSAMLRTSTVPWATGAAVLVMVYSLGNISGAHLNPAVTLAVVLSGRDQCSLTEGLAYMVAQAAAGVAAALTCLMVRRSSSFTNSDRVMDLGPKMSYGWPSVGIGETVFTLAIALVWLCMLSVKSPRYPKAPTSRSFEFGLAIGLCVTSGSFALEGMTGGILNPAVTLGVSVSNFVSSGWYFSNRISLFALYCGWEALGAVIAAAIFMLVHPLEYKKDPLMGG